MISAKDLFMEARERIQIPFEIIAPRSRRTRSAKELKAEMRQASRREWLTANGIESELPISNISVYYHLNSISYAQ